MASKTEYNYEDSELVYYVRESHEEAKEILYDKYLPLLYKEINSVRSIALSCGADLADLTQEALIAFSDAINSFKDDEDAKFITFATVCIKRKISTYLRRKTVKNEGKATSLDDPLFDSTVLDFLEDKKGVEPLKQMITKEKIDEVLRRAKKLSENELDALRYELEGLSHEEIGKKLNKTTKQVYNLIHRAHMKMKQDKYNSLYLTH